MSANSFGKLFRITTFGESHGPGIGVVIDGCPAGLLLDTVHISNQLSRRRPGQSHLTTQRNEQERFEILSGIFNEKTTGAPIALLVRNTDQRPEDYSAMGENYRPGHADLTYDQKYGHRDYRGGGRSSARETLARVIGGSVALQLLAKENIRISAYVSQIGNIAVPEEFTLEDPAHTERSLVRCPDPATSDRMITLLEQLKSEGNTIGGTITCLAKGIPAGLGEPVYGKLQSSLAAAMLSINAAKGFDYGSGFAHLDKTGKELNDPIRSGPAGPEFLSNHAGGIQGGISNGQELRFRVAFKPVSTILQAQETINRAGENVVFTATGRHDPCVLPRAVPVVEAMCALVLADHYLLARASAPLK